MKRAALAVTLWFVVAGAATAQQPAAGADSIDLYVRAEMQRRHLPGAAVAVVKDGKIFTTRGYGLANLELSVPASANTAFQIASITKMFTATAVMMLARDGKVDLDRKVSTYLATLPAAWSEITVRQLLAHTSGINPQSGFAPDRTRGGFTPQEIVDAAAKEPLVSLPGQKWNYSNVGYAVLGMLIEKVSGRSYADFVRERLFQPLGMRDTRANDLSAIIPNRASGYEWADGPRNSDFVNPSLPFSAGMLISTVGDLATWDLALSSNAALDSATLNEMWTPTTASVRGTKGYGFGWETELVNGHRMVGHGGDIPGFRAHYARFMDDRLSVIVLVNANGPTVNPKKIALGIAGIIQPSLARKDEPMIADLNPRETARIKLVVERIVNGEADPLFAPDFAKGIAPLLAGNRQHGGLFGKLRELQLVDRKENSNGAQFQFRAVFEAETTVAIIGIDKQGRVVQWGMRAEE